MQIDVWKKTTFRNMLIYKRYLVNLAAIIISKMPTLRFLALNYKQRQISHFVVMNIFETNSFLCSFPHKNYRVLFLKLILSSLVTVSSSKLWLMTVPTQGLSSRQLSKLGNLSWVDAWYWKPINITHVCRPYIQRFYNSFLFRISTLYMLSLRSLLF